MLRVGAESVTYLEDLLVWQRGGSLGDGAGIVDRARHRRLQIHVLASGQGGEGDLAMQVCWRGDDHALNGLVFQQRFVVVVSLGGRRSLGGALHRGLIVITNGDQRCVGQAAELRDDVPTLRSEPNEPHLNRRPHRLLLVVGIRLGNRKRAIRRGLGVLGTAGDWNAAHRGHHGGHRAGLEKITPIEVGGRSRRRRRGRELGIHVMSGAYRSLRRCQAGDASGKMKPPSPSKNQNGRLPGERRPQ